MKINNMRYLVLFCISLTYFGCQKTSNINEYLIEKAIFSKEFKDSFQICVKRENEISVFNDLKENLDFTFSKENECDKTMKLSKIDFVYDVNSIQSSFKGIVFFGFDRDIDSYKLSFLDLETNVSLKLKYDNEQKLIGTSVGQF